MNLNSIWSAFEESFEEFDEVVSPAIVKFANEMNLPSGWGPWAVAIALFPSEPISAAATIVHRFVLGSTLEREPGIGLLFTELADLDLLRIRQFVHHRTLGDLRWD